MRKVIRVAVREYKAAVKTKAFIIMLVLLPIMMGGSAICMKLLEDRLDTNDKRLAIIDRSGQIAPAVVAAAKAHNENEIHDADTGKKIGPAYYIEIVPPRADDPAAQRLELSDRVRARELYAFVEIGADVVAPGDDAGDARIGYHSDNAVMDDTRRWIGAPINNQIRALRLGAANLDPQTVDEITRWTSVEPLGLVSVGTDGVVTEAERSSELVAILRPMITMMAMFMMVIAGVAPLVNAVLEEKMQRIAEVLLGSIKPFELMLGKLIGTVLVSLTILALYLGGGFLLAWHNDVTEYIPLDLLPWFLVFMVAAILMFGSLLIALTAACSDLKEAQSMIMPVWLLIMLPMFVWLPVVKQPLSDFATWASLFPPATPTLMLLRQTSPTGIPAWQPWVGLIGVLAVTAFAIWAAGRIFRIGLLMQGKAPKLTELLRWAVRG